MSATVTARATLSTAQQPVAEALYTLYVESADSLHATLRRLAPRSEADDLLQEVFLVALRQAEVVLKARSPRAWLFGVALQVARAHRRRQFFRRLLNLDAVLEVAADDDVHRQVEWRSRARLAAVALEKLTAKKREVFVLFELEGLTGDEIAIAVGCPLKTVWSRLEHARSELLATVDRLERQVRR